MTRPTPSAQAPIVDSAGRATPAWFRFFASLGSGSRPAGAMHVSGASPLVFTAPGPGLLVISGGTVTALSMLRGSVSLPLPVGAATLPLGNGDKVSIAFTSAPNMTFLPS